MWLDAGFSVSKTWASHCTLTCCLLQWKKGKITQKNRVILISITGLQWGISCIPKNGKSSQFGEFFFTKCNLKRQMRARSKALCVMQKEMEEEKDVVENEREEEISGRHSSRPTASALQPSVLSLRTDRQNRLRAPVRIRPWWGEEVRGLGGAGTVTQHHLPSSSPWPPRCVKTLACCTVERGVKLKTAVSFFSRVNLGVFFISFRPTSESRCGGVYNCTGTC
jgi:hypothetical protein